MNRVRSRSNSPTWSVASTVLTAKPYSISRPGHHVVVAQEQATYGEHAFLSFRCTENVEMTDRALGPSSRIAIAGVRPVVLVQRAASHRGLVRARRHLLVRVRRLGQRLRLKRRLQRRRSTAVGSVATSNAL